MPDRITNIYLNNATLQGTLFLILGILTTFVAVAYGAYIVGKRGIDPWSIVAGNSRNTNGNNYGDQVGITNKTNYVKLNEEIESGQ